MVLTSYDIEFDSGLVGSYLYNPNHELQRYTKLPIPFITRFTSTIHISNDANVIHVLNNSTTATAATYPTSDKIEQNKRKHISHPKWQMISKKFINSFEYIYIYLLIHLLVNEIKKLSH